MFCQIVCKYRQIRSHQLGTNKEEEGQDLTAPVGDPRGLQNVSKSFFQGVGFSLRLVTASCIFASTHPSSSPQ